MPSNVILIDDDAFFSQTVEGICSDLGHVCSLFVTVADVEPTLIQPAPGFCVVDLAVPLGGATQISSVEAKGGHAAAPALIRLARKTGWTSTRFAIITGRACNETRKWCDQNQVAYMIKPVDRSQLERFLGHRTGKAFVVHGRDQKALERVKKSLAKCGIEAVVLMEQPEKGRTVIEKFEEVATECDYAIVLATPDDVGGLAAAKRRQRRMRQNVVFELGYFCGAYGRRTGRVAFIEFGDTDIPSDLAGLVRIDGSVSPSKLAKKLANELA